ncbi:MAG: amino acid adenylation domain-containing protein [Acidobacteria bacterium]|nr:amino acid adenylation domain-containing protein [Acidobacteriota bacterium]
MAGPTRSRRELSEADRGRLAARLAAGRRAAAGQRIPAREAGAPAPLSFGQQQLWFLNRVAPGSGYGIALALPLEGPLDPGALRQAIAAIVDRHETLRTVFVEDAAGARQHVLAPGARGRPLELALPLEDVSGEPPDAAARRAAEARAAFADQRFDLASGPLFLARLLRYSDRRHDLLLSFHHIVADGWAVGVFARELAAAYAALVDGRPLDLPPLPIQYGDFAAWQRAHLQGEVLERELAFWRGQLAGAAVVELAPDRPRPSAPTFRGAAERVAVPASLAGALRDLARHERVTLYSVLLGALKALLFRCTGQSDLAIGTPMANRTRPEVEHLIGLFANSVVVRSRVQPAMTFREVLAREHDASIAAVEHQDLPFERLVQDLAPVRDLGRNPLFQIAFNLLDGTGAPPVAGPLRFLPLQGLTENTRFDLEVHAVDRGDAIGIDFLYATDLFERETMARLQRSYLRLLAAAADQPDAPIGTLAVLGEGARSEILAAGRADSPYPREATLAELFDAAAARFGGAIAIEDGSTRWTYTEAAQRARRLAVALRAAGIGPNAPVGVWLERGAPLVTTLVGVALAGGAYVPLDPGQPPGRAAAVLADTGTRVIVTREALAATVPDGAWQVIALESLEGAAIEPLAPRGAATDAAYILFTSGSTGRPHGVGVPQRAVVRLVCGANYVELGPATVMAQCATAAFDAATFEIWGALLHGGRLVVVPTDVAVSPGALAAYLQRTGVTTMFLTTALIHQIGRELPAALAGVDTVLFGGEAVAPRWIAAIRAAGGPRRLVHVYGPTETTTFATWSEIAGVNPDDATIPIGGPISQTACHVLDAGGELSLLGVPGELHIGGDGLADGYLGAPRLTAEKFVPDAFGGVPGARLYRTGDQVRWRRPGVIDFLGRRDGQIKLRGFRIELGEVEAALASAPGVGGSVVVVDGEGPARRLIGYVVPLSGAGLDPAAIREAVKAQLPAYMVPAAIVPLAAWPLNANGKVDRRALPPPDEERAAAGSFVAPQTGLEQTVAGVWQSVLGVAAVGTSDNFFDLGGHSLLLVRVQGALEAALGRPVPLVALFRYPTVGALAAHLDGNAPAQAEAAALPSAGPAPPDEPIAIVGLAGRFPGAPDVETFWRNVAAGVESIRRFTVGELEAEGVPARIFDDPHYVPAKGVLDDADRFDASLFGYTPREAALLDPQQRVLLECAWTALEHAGYAPTEPIPERVGVYAGASASSYIGQIDPAVLQTYGRHQLLLATDKDFAATRVSYKLGLRGPAVSVQTACSTSLVAVHVACQALRAGECELALAGGVSVTSPLSGGYLYQPDGIASPDGRCRPFDAAAAGTVAGNGVGVVVLKLLRLAVAAGDTIHAVIRGTAINNDGAGKVGFTAPSVTGQAAVVRAALAAAAIDPATIGYVEAHGTGTALGDPIEVAALGEAFGAGAGPGTCALGSVKGNVGHLDAAAGVTGLIKAVQALRHRTIPPSLHFTQPNPQLTLGPFYVPTAAQPWPAHLVPRRAGVSSFGMGGTNAHVVLEEAPAPEARAAAAAWQVLPVSGQTEAAALAAAAHLADCLETDPAVTLADVACTQQIGRAALPVRLAVAGDSAIAIAAALRQARPTRITGGHRPLVWLCPGQGVALAGVAAAIAADAVCRAELDACAAAVQTADAGLDLNAVLTGGTIAAAETPVALVAVTLALAARWRAWGLQPAAVLGHSVGELAAAVIAGVLSREAALDLAILRGRLMAAQPPGGMLAVAAGEAAVAAHLSREVTIAAVNSPTQCVVAGPHAALDDLVVRLTAEGLSAQRLPAHGAFHSPLMAGVVAPLAARAARWPSAPPAVPWISSVTGVRLAAVNAAYWGSQVTSTVRWTAALETARALSPAPVIWLEVGPGRTLTGLARAGAPAGETAVASLGPDLAAGVAPALAQLWQAGVALDWSAGHPPGARRRIALPTYPFQRERYWLDPAPPPSAAGSLDRKASVADWLYARCWRQTPPSRSSSGKQHVVLLGDAGGEAALLARALEARGAVVTAVVRGDRWRADPGRYTIDPAVEAHYGQLAEALRQSERRPTRLVHAWNATSAPRPPCSAASLREALDRGFYSLLYAARGFSSSGPLTLNVLSNATQSVQGDELGSPLDAPLVGLCRVIPQEHPNLLCRSIDVAVGAHADPRQVDALAAEILSESDDRVVAWRHQRRWIESYEPIAAGAARTSSFREGGVYLITGGLGRIGLGLALHLARVSRAALLLVARTPLPPADRWPHWLDTHAPDDPTSARIRQLRAIEAAGGRPIVLTADVADRAKMIAALAAAEEAVGPIHGVVHAAGATRAGDFMALADLDRPAAERHFASKAFGLLTLDEILRERRLDFRIVMSSLSSVLGGLGFGPYAAANAFMDGLAGGGAQGAGGRWTSILWDGWALDAGQGTLLGMSHAEGIEALERVLEAGDLPVVAVSTADLAARIARSTTRTAPPPAAIAESVRREVLSSTFAEPRTLVERTIVHAWERALGVSGIGAADNFFELGGDSLLAVSLVPELGRELQVGLTVRHLWKAPTVAGLAALVDDLRRTDEDVLASALDAVHGLSDEEVDRLLADTRRSHA